MINNFLQTFANILSQGTIKISAIVIGIMTIVAGIDYILSAIYEYSAGFSSFAKKFVTKLIKYSICFAIAAGYPKIIDAIIRAIFGVGYLFFKNAPASQFPDFDNIFAKLRESILEIEKLRNTLSWRDIGTNIAMIVIIFAGYFCAFLIIKEIIVLYIEFRMAAALGVILLPFLAFEQTKSIGEKTFHTLLTSGAKLMVSICLTGVTLTILNGNDFVGSSNINIGDCMIWLFSIGLAAYLVTQSKEIGTMLATGSSSGRSGAGVVGSAISAGVGMGVGAVGAIAATTVGGIGAIKQGKEALANGKNFRGVLNAMREGGVKGKDILNSSRIGKIGSKLGGAIKNTAGVATGQKDVFSFAKDSISGIGGAVKDQALHDKNDVKEKIATFGIDSAGKMGDYMNSGENFKNATKEAKEAFSKGEKLDESASGVDKVKNFANRAKESFKAFNKGYKESKKNQWDNITKKDGVFDEKVKTINQNIDENIRKAYNKDYRNNGNSSENNNEK